MVARFQEEQGRPPGLSVVLVGDDPAHVKQLVEATRPPKASAERHARAANAGTVEQLPKPPAIEDDPGDPE